MPSRRVFLTSVSVVLAGCGEIPAITTPQINEQPCPPPPVNHPADSVICSHADTHSDIEVIASPTNFSTTPESLQGLSLTITNETERQLRFTRGQWRLYRNAGWGWREQEVSVLSSGETETIESGGSWSWSGIDAMFDLGAAGRTPAGLYVAVLSVWRDKDPDDNSIKWASVDCVFLFRVIRQYTSEAGEEKMC